jgi:hypothetical protein
MRKQTARYEHSRERPIRDLRSSRKIARLGSIRGRWKEHVMTDAGDVDI